MNKDFKEKKNEDKEKLSNLLEAVADYKDYDS